MLNTYPSSWSIHVFSRNEVLYDLPKMLQMIHTNERKDWSRHTSVAFYKGSKNFTICCASFRSQFSPAIVVVILSQRFSFYVHAHSQQTSGNLVPRAHVSFGQRQDTLTKRHVGSGNEIALPVKILFPLRPPEVVKKLNKRLRTFFECFVHAICLIGYK